MTTTTLDDILQETDEERAALRARVAEIRGRDWHDVPAGYYALPVLDLGAWEEDCPDDWQPPVMGWSLWHRKTAKVYKSGPKAGRAYGRSWFKQGSVMAADGYEVARVRDYVISERQTLAPYYVNYMVDEILHDLAAGDTFRATYGKLTGRCGCCGRALTDPDSKMRGIGPDCAGLR